MEFETPAKTVSCQFCRFLSRNLRSHVSHLRQVHSNDPGFSLVCGIQHCCQHFTTFGAYNSHVYRVHRASMGLKSPNDSSDLSSSDDHQETILSTDPEDEVAFTYCFENHEPTGDIQHDVWQLLGTSNAHQQKEAAKLLLKLKEVRSVTDRTIGEVIDGCQGLISHSLSVVKASVRDVLGNAGINFSDVEGLDEAFRNVPGVFQGLETTYKQEKYFRENFNLVEPIEISFDNVYINRFSGSKRQKVQSACTFFYVPLADSLTQLLRNEEVLKEIHTVRSSDNTFLRDYCDGSFYKNHPLFSDEDAALQIVAYFDELEVTNPIGSYVNTHKLGCLFFTLGNIRPMYRSSLKAIFLLAVARSQDIDRYGMDTFLRPFVDDLKRLYADGLTVSVGSTEYKYYGALIAFLADTQAAHKVGGFKGSVSFARRICRTCMATRTDTQSLFTESQFELRTPEKHEKQCRSLIGPNRHDNSVKYGINRTSVLEEAPGFSVVTGLPHDIMHDLFEGVVHYEFKLFFHYCVSSKFFSVETLNNRLRGFDFGMEDKPSLIDASSLDHADRKFSQSAAQTITLVRYLPLLIGDKIPGDNKHWHSILILIKICQIALSPVHSHDTVPYLQILVEEKLQLLKELYPGASLKPKMHYMVHYPSQIERHGPLVHSWTMRHEAKLSFVKRSSRRGNFKNIQKTVVKHHQLWLCYQLECESHMLCPKPQLSPKETCSVLSTECDTVKLQILTIAPSLPPNCSLKHHRWLKIHSLVYKIGTFVLLQRDDMAPKFGRIEDIIVSENQIIFFLVEVHLGYSFSTHYNAFMVNSTLNKLVIDVHSLKDHHPLMVRKSFDVSDHCLYIVLPYIY